MTRRSSVDGKFVGTKPVDRIREGLKVAYQRKLEEMKPKDRETTDPWELNPAKLVSR